MKNNYNIFCKTSLQNRSNIVIWHDFLNNSLYPHESNGNHRSTPEKLLEILEPFRNKYRRLCTIIAWELLSFKNLWLLQSFCQAILVNTFFPIARKRIRNIPRSFCEFIRKYLLSCTYFNLSYDTKETWVNCSDVIDRK